MILCDLFFFVFDHFFKQWLPSVYENWDGPIFVLFVYFSPPITQSLLTKQ